MNHVIHHHFDFKTKIKQSTVKQLLDSTNHEKIRGKANDLIKVFTRLANRWADQLITGDKVKNIR